jgi:outer membrane protein assembly factor BamB
MLWVKRYDGMGKGYDVATALGVSPNGSRVFVTGSSTFDYATVAYDASTGARLWVERYDGPVNSSDLAADIGVSPDGSRVFVTGGSLGSASRRDYATLAYDASTGAKLWVERYDGPGHHIDSPRALRVSPDSSKVFVTGGSVGSTNSYDFATVAYDASSGATLWVKRYDGMGNAYDVAHALGVSPDSSKVFVTGESYESTSGCDYATRCARSRSTRDARSSPWPTTPPAGPGCGYSITTARVGSAMRLTPVF